MAILRPKKLCQCHLELEQTIRLSSFYLCHLSSSKNFNHITKDTTVIHLKSGNSHRLNHFLTFTPSKHTSHHHYCSIANRQFFIWPTYHNWSIMNMEFFSQLLWTNLMSYHFSLFLNFTPLYIFLIYSLFFIKAL
jgi:hypothetical protein